MTAHYQEQPWLSATTATGEELSLYTNDLTMTRTRPTFLPIVCLLLCACGGMPVSSQRGDDGGPQSLESRAQQADMALDAVPARWLYQDFIDQDFLLSHARVAVEPEAQTRDKSPPDDSLWSQLRRQMQLSHHLEEKRVQQEIRWLQRHPAYLQRLQTRLQQYLPYIYTQTQLRSLPAELALLPIVESALDPFAFSHGGAAGPWQFIRGTARQYGLPINAWYDGRRDLVASTHAALDYLEDLHARFDDWELALAGYNAGQGNVSRALRKNPGAGFFDLHLPTETQAYVPRLLALSAVIRDPAAFGIDLPELTPQTTFYVLDIHGQFQLSKLAAILDIDIDTLYRWNPALNQWATPPAGPHRVLLPVSVDATHAQARVDAVPANARVDWQEIEVHAGDTLGRLAAQHGTDVDSLIAANALTGSVIRAGQMLLIPKHAAALQSTPRNARGSTLYTVKSGDSMWSVARAHNVSLNALIRNNHIGPKDTLSVGTTLKIPGGHTRRQVTRKVHYKVRKGDSLARIASKFNVTVRQIGEWNQLDTQRYIQPGQGLLLYVNVLGG